MIKKLTPSNYEEIKEIAASIIKVGGVLILPFDTVYGFVCDPNNDSALEKIFELKKRPKNQTIGLTVDGFDTLQSIADVNFYEKFIQAKIPGPYTFILPTKKLFSNYCTKNHTIGVRLPDSQLIISLAKKSGGVLAQTSANVSGKGNCFSLGEIRGQYAINDLSKIDLIIDGGKLKSHTASTIFDLTGKIPREIERT